MFSLKASTVMKPSIVIISVFLDLTVNLLFLFGKFINSNLIRFEFMLDCIIFHYAFFIRENDLIFLIIRDSEFSTNMLHGGIDAKQI